MEEIGTAVIVADTNLIAYLLIEGTRTPQARRVFTKDPVWTAPVLWRSEFRNVLAGYLHGGALDLMDALRIAREAENLLEGGEYDVPTAPVLSLAGSSGCSAYDCEFVALARDLRVRLVTSDAKVLAAFPTIAVAPGRFTSE